MEELSKFLTLEMLPEGLYKDIAEAIGTENFVKLAEVVGGATIYIPKPESLTRPVRDARIKEEFNGYNHPELAKKYGVTERWVRQVCGNGNHEGQMDLFASLDGDLQ
jgi:Mor family transcriptional regulator